MNSRNDIRKFWTIINSLTPQKHKFCSPNCINTNGLINNTDDMAEEFNNHYCIIVKKLSDKVNANNSPKFSAYLKGVFPRQCFLVLLRQWKFITASIKSNF